MTSDRVYLSHIHDSIGLISDYVRGGIDELRTDRKTQDAVVRNLEIIGEAMKNLTPEFRAHTWRCPGK